MGLIKFLLKSIGGSPVATANAIKDTAHIWRENAEGAATRMAADNLARLDQFGAEFRGGSGPLTQCVDFLNRLPRPAIALGTIGLFIYAMADPIGFADRMIGLDLIPDELWWLFAAIVTFFFGGRELHYVRKSNAAKDSVSAARQVVQAKQVIGSLRPKGPLTPMSAVTDEAIFGRDSNSVLEDVMD